MSKKTAAYGEGYTVGKANGGVESNPYNESEQIEQHGDWLIGYADGIADEPIEEEDEEVFEEEFEEEDEDDYDEDEDEE